LEAGVSLITRTTLFGLAIAALLTIIAGVACLLLNFVYVNWVHVPIETLAVMVFFFKVAPCVFLAGIFYAVGAKRILDHKGITGSLSQFRVAFAVGAFATVLILAILFPCDVQPYFIGGYLMKTWFLGQ
jgi:hypothetical protein